MDGKFSFFALPDSGGSPPAKLVIDAEGNPIRKRQPHHKSRYGCTTCKRRKVKCDEATPACHNCTRRNMQCSFNTPSKTTIEYCRDLHLQPDSESTRESTSSLEESLNGHSTENQSSVLEESPNGHSTEFQSSSCFRNPFPDPNLLFGVQIQEITTPIDQEQNLVPSQKYPLTPLEMLDRLPSYSSRASCSSRETTHSEIAEADEVDSGINPVRQLIEIAPDINSSEKELLLHFEEFTSKNLALSTKIWGASVLKCALKERHPSHYRSSPGLPLITLPARSQIDLQHFSNALSGLRNALANEMTLENFESIVSCTVIFIHYAWISIGQDPNIDIDLAGSFKQIAEHSHGLKDCVVVARDVFEKTKWASTLAHSPKISLERFSSKTPSAVSKISDVFGHCIFCGLGTKIPANASNDNVDALQRLLIPVNVILISAPDIESSGLMEDIYRYFFTWPTKCTKGFLQQVDEGNPVSLLILMYYYAAIVRIDTERIWWLRDGALRMFHQLRSRFNGQCLRCIDIPLALLAIPGQEGTTGV